MRSEMIKYTDASNYLYAKTFEIVLSFLGFFQDRWDTPFGIPDKRICDFIKLLKEHADAT